MKSTMIGGYILILCTLELPAQNSALSSSDSLREEINKLFEQQDFMAAIELAQAAYQSNVDQKNFLEIAHSLHLLSRGYALSGNFEKAIEFGEKGSVISEILDQPALEYNINNILSWSYFELGRPLDFRLKHQKDQLTLVEKLDNPNARALVENNYGYDLTVSGSVHLDSAIQLMTSANEFYAQKEGHKGRWYTLMNLCWQYRLKNELKTSIDFGKISVEQAASINDRHAIIESMANLGESLLAKGELEQAGDYYLKALSLAKEKDDRDRFVFDVYYAHFLWRTDKPLEAVNRLNEAIAFLQNGEVLYEMMARILLARIYEGQKKMDKAMEQIGKIERPRNDYISFETKFMAALVKAKILRSENKSEWAEIHIKPYLNKAKEIGADYLLKLAGGDYN